ncbi:MAG: carboxypeptidase-like regulatory domain-containing protein [Chlorobi bacterium]|nr:carboxypeptidase-like regulatory domain-containing protein [Chlorobiota bacterium]
MKQLLFTILFFLITGVSFSQTIVKGVVFEAGTKETLPGADVIEKGTKNTTLTNKDGNFALTLTKKTFPDTLIFSYIGFLEKNIIIKNENDTMLNVFLEENKNSDIAVCFLLTSYPLFSVSGLSLNGFDNYGYNAEIFLLKSLVDLSYSYSSDRENNIYKKASIYFNVFFKFNLNYEFENFNFQNRNINLLRHKFGISKHLKKEDLTLGVFYSDNIDFFDNKSFSSVKFSFNKKFIISKYPYIFLTYRNGIEFYEGKVSFQTGGLIRFPNIKKKCKTIHYIYPEFSVNYNTFGDMNMLYLKLGFKFYGNNHF